MSRGRGDQLRALFTAAAVGICAACASSHSLPPVRPISSSPEEQVVVLALQHELDRMAPSDAPQTVYVKVLGKLPTKQVLQRLRVPKGVQVHPVSSWKCLTGGCWAVSVSPDGEDCAVVEIKNDIFCGECRPSCAQCPPRWDTSTSYVSVWCHEGTGWRMSYWGLLER